MGRAPCCDKANVKRGPWSPEEDAALRKYIETQGTGGNWIALPHKAGLKRCGKSCRLRWLNYLRPDIKHGNFSEEEDNIICTLYKNIGSRWSVIASHLPGRTDNDVKNYWNTKLKKRVIAGQPMIHTGINTTTTTPPPPTPPHPSFVPNVKAEEYSFEDFAMAQNHALASGLAINHNGAPRFFSELPPFPMTVLVDQPDYSSNMSGYGVSPSEDISAASSSVTMDNSAAYMNWPVSGAGAEDMFSAELGFGSFSDFLNGYDTLNNMGDGAQHCVPSLATLASLFTSPESKPQGLTFS